MHWPPACLPACLLQAADEAELAKQAAAKAAAQHQKDVQMQQLEDLKTRLRAERWAAACLPD
jgi:hypothetical protein